MYLGVDLFVFILFGTRCAFCTWVFVSFIRFGKFSAIVLSNTFFTHFSLSSPSRTPYNVDVDMLYDISEIS